MESIQSLAKNGIWEDLLRQLQELEEMNQETDWSIHLIDSMITKAHPHSAGARHQVEKSVEKKRQSEYIGKTQGGWFSKIYMRTDVSGRPICFYLTEGLNGMIQNTFQS